MGLIDAARREIRFLSGGLRTLARVRGLTPDGPANVADELERSVDRFATRTAILFEDEVWTYRDMDQRANRYARWACDLGLGPGDVVCLFMENQPDYLCVWFGLAKVGVATALINNQLTGRGLAHCVTETAARHVIVDADLSDAWKAATPHLSGSVTAWRNRGHEVSFADLDHALASQSDARPSPARRRVLQARDLALYIFTSGTTGLPKAARISHLRVLLTMHSFAAATGAGPQDVIYAPLPLYHTVGGVCAPGVALTTGGAIALRRRFSANAFWPDCRRFGATMIQYIGELCRYLVNAPHHPDETRHRVKLAVGNGLRPDVWDRFQTRFKVSRILEFYGATESNLTLFNFDGGRHAVGRQPPYMRAAVNVALVRFDRQAAQPERGDDGLCIRCKTGEIGEAIARIDPTQAKMRFEGYSNEKETSAKILRDVFVPGDAWFRSGDLMRQDRLGYLYFVDRIGDTYRWKGENVSTSEVAQVLCSAPGVLEANVYGVETPCGNGRAGMAALVVDESRFSPAALRQVLHAELPAYARPLFLRFPLSTEATGTFKQVKVKVVEEGFDPGLVSDPILFDDARTKAYIPLDMTLHRQIVDGDLRL